jgi:hypothetical protein
MALAVNRRQYLKNTTSAQNYCLARDASNNKLDVLAVHSKFFFCVTAVFDLSLLIHCVSAPLRSG